MKTKSKSQQKRSAEVMNDDIKRVFLESNLDVNRTYPWRKLSEREDLQQLLIKLKQYPEEYVWIFFEEILLRDIERLNHLTIHAQGKIKENNHLVNDSLTRECLMKIMSFINE